MSINPIDKFTTLFNLTQQAKKESTSNMSDERWYFQRLEGLSELLEVALLLDGHLIALSELCVQVQRWSNRGLIPPKSRRDLRTAKRRILQLKKDLRQCLSKVGRCLAYHPQINDTTLTINQRLAKGLSVPIGEFTRRDTLDLLQQLLVLLRQARGIASMISIAADDIHYYMTRLEEQVSEMSPDAATEQAHTETVEACSKPSEESEEGWEEFCGDVQQLISVGGVHLGGIRDLYTRVSNLTVWLPSARTDFRDTPTEDEIEFNQVIEEVIRKRKENESR